VSMGANAGLKLMQICENVRTIIAIELLAGAQGLEFLKPLTPSRGVQAAYDEIRKTVSKIDADRPLHQDIKLLTELIEKGLILSQVETVVDPLK